MIWRRKKGSGEPQHPSSKYATDIYIKFESLGKIKLNDFCREPRFFIHSTNYLFDRVFKIVEHFRKKTGKS